MHYSFPARLNIQSDVFQDFRVQFDVLLAALLSEANTTGKDGELTVKLKVSTATERSYKEGTFVKEWTEPRLSWTLSRKVKESKYDVKSSSGHGFALEFDKDGSPVIREVQTKHVSMFDTMFSRKVEDVAEKNYTVGMIENELDPVFPDDDSLDELDSGADEIEDAITNLTEEFNEHNLAEIDRITEEITEAAAFDEEMNYESEGV